MKPRTKIAVGAAVLVSAVVGLALATPPLKLAPTLLAMGTDNTAIEAHGVAPVGDEEFHVRLTTNGPSNIGVQEAAFAPGGSIGWHSHPGLVTVQVVSGSIQWFDENCIATVYNVGDAWTEGSAPHYFRNIGTVNATVIATLVVAKGAGFRVDQPAPACAAALGLN
jgi:quercetin dioxygenase-like cupin family protein